MHPSLPPAMSGERKDRESESERERERAEKHSEREGEWRTSWIGLCIEGDPAKHPPFEAEPRTR
eukprot:1097783-Amorphochlora_amoeboformis.AAC.1